jgi:PAS domain S-box-containing protein
MDIKSMRALERKWWKLPGWFYYLVAVGTAVLALALRYQLDEHFPGGRAVLVFATVPVALSAFLGGLGPGITAAIIGLLGSVYFFIAPFHTFAIGYLDDRIDVGGFGIVWVFISIICDYMRRVTMRLSEQSARALEQKGRLDSILASITDAFFAVDREWCIRFANDRFAHLVGMSQDDLNGKYLWSVLEGESYHRTRIRMDDSLRSGEPFSMDLEEPDMEQWFHIRGYPMADGMFVYMQDVTERKHLEEGRERLLQAERKARSDAESMNQMKDEFVATLSHELRTPLTTILGWTEVLQRLPNLDKKQEEGLAAIERSVRLQTQLVGDLLDMSRIAAGKLKLEVEFVNLEDVVYEAVELTRAAADSKGIQIEIEVRDDRTFVRGDPKRLYQVLTNLLSNAAKFTPKGGVVRIELFCADSSVHCAVTDSGDGIDPEFLPFLFDRFRQADSSSTRRFGGLGLGLAIVKQLVELHGGTVQAWSAGKGKGSRFEISLPLAAVPSAMLLDGNDPSAAIPSLEGLRVLTVDDDAGTRQLLEKMLSDAGADVLVADSGETALNILRDRKCDVIVSDIGMPQMDGYQFLREARRLFPGVGELPPAIALTAFAHEKDFALSAEAGFLHHLTKPVEFAKLVRTIHAVGHADASL